MALSVPTPECFKLVKIKNLSVFLYDTGIQLLRRLSRFLNNYQCPVSFSDGIDMI